MVSLEARSQYLHELESDEYSSALVAFLWRKTEGDLTYTSTSNANEIAKGALLALRKENADVFSSLYDDISRRKPKADSEWLNNDVLLFALVLGVIKFDLNRDWLDEVLAIRLEHSQEESRAVAQTFRDLLKDNFQSTNNHQALMLVMQDFLDLSLGTAEQLNSAYQALTQSRFPYSKATFLNLICLKALDVIISAKGLVDIPRQKALDRFVIKFNRRITMAATILWFLLLFVDLGMFGLFVHWYLELNSAQAERVTRILTALPFLGFPGVTVPLLVYRAKMINAFRKPFLRYYGYDAERIPEA